MENSPLYSSKHDAARSTDTGKDQPGTWAALGHGLPSGKRGLDSQGNELKPSLQSQRASSPTTFLTFPQAVTTRFTIIIIRFLNLNDLPFHPGSLSHDVGLRHSKYKFTFKIHYGTNSELSNEGCAEEHLRGSDVMSSCWWLHVCHGWTGLTSVVSGFPKCTRQHYLILSAFQQKHFVR